jgi:hypothetical protein
MCLTAAVVQTAPEFFSFGIGFPLSYAGWFVAVMLSDHNLIMGSKSNPVFPS